MPTIQALLWATDTHASVSDVYDDRARGLETTRNIAQTDDVGLTKGITNCPTRLDMRTYRRNPRPQINLDMMARAA